MCLNNWEQLGTFKAICVWIGWQPKTPLQELTTNKTQNSVSCWYKYLWLYFKSQLNWWSTIVTCCRFVSWMSVLSVVGWFCLFLVASSETWEVLEKDRVSSWLYSNLDPWVCQERLRLVGGKQKAAQAVQAREIVMKERGNKRERENQAQTVLECAH